ncbi:MAG: DNA polymerase III subunit alpha, partial [Maritimibacter sp.]
HEQRKSNQVSLFGEAGDDLPEPRLSPLADWLPSERLAEERKAIGFYLSGHPLDDYMPALKRKGVLTLEELAVKAERAPLVAKLAGTVSGRQERKSAKGNRFAYAQLSDPSGLYEVTIFSDTLEKCRDHLETGANVVVTVEANVESEQLKLLARSVAPVDTVVADAGGMALKLYIDAVQALPAVSDLLEQARATAKGVRPGSVALCLMDPSLPGEVEMDLSEAYPLNPQIKGALKSLPGVMSVEEV